MPKTLTQTEAAEHLERAWIEATRLQERASMRSMAEKKRLGVLQAVVPKLRRLAKGAATASDAVTPNELAVLDWLKAVPAKPAS